MTTDRGPRAPSRTRTARDAGTRRERPPLGAGTIPPRAVRGRRGAAGALLAALLAASAFASIPGCASNQGTAEKAPAPVQPTTPAADPLGSLPSHPGVVRYTGPFARDPAVLAFQRDAGRLLDAAIPRLADETGLTFLDGRTPRVVVSDEPDLPATGTAGLRLIDGVRRPEIKVPAAALAAGEFRPAENLAELVAESGVLAASPERAPPEWLRRGIPPLFAKSVERRAAELILGGETVRTGAAALGALEPSFRLAALQRIGVGERVLPRFLAARLGGMGDGAALREVGVGSIDFLDAAAATEADRAAEQAVEDSRVDALVRARAALLAGDTAGAQTWLGRMGSADGEDPRIDAEVRLARAEAALVRGDAGPAVAPLDEILAKPDRVLRLRDARYLRALAAVRAGDPAARTRAAEFARTHLMDPRTAPILADLGVATQDAFDLASGDPAARVRAAQRMGRPDGGGVEYLAASLRDGDASVRRAIVQALGRIGGDAAVAAAASASNESDPGVRGSALAAVAAADKARGLALARVMMGDPDEAVRKAATALVDAAKPKPAPVAAKPDPKKTGTAKPDPNKAGEKKPADTGAKPPPAQQPPAPPAPSNPPPSAGAKSTTPPPAPLPQPKTPEPPPGLPRVGPQPQTPPEPQEPPPPPRK